MSGCTVAIRNNSTGEVRLYRDSYPWNEFQWMENNYSCDCNRHLFFERAGGKDDGSEFDTQPECGETAFSIVWHQDDDGPKVIVEQRPEGREI